MILLKFAEQFQNTKLKIQSIKIGGKESLLSLKQIKKLEKLFLAII